MKITNDILANKGIDPALFTYEEKQKIGHIIDQISDLGKEKSLVSIFPSYDDSFSKEATICKNANSARSSVDSILKDIIKVLEEMASIPSSMNNIFSTGISKHDTDKILHESALKMNILHSHINNALHYIGEMYSSVALLSEIQLKYNSALYELGLINVAIKFSGKIESDEIFEAINTAFERLNDITAFINDLKDRAVIGETALEKKIPSALKEISSQLDFNNDGAELNTTKMLDAIILAKQLVTTVIER